MRTKTKCLSSPGGLPCFECEGGRLEPVVEDYTTSHPSRGEIVVPAVPMLRCDSCGDTVIGDDGNRKIDAWLDKELNAISPQEIQAFLNKYQLTQKQASAITGLGEKNICRWLSGHSRPSESVSNYLRVLLAEDSAFERLKTSNFDPSPKPVWPLEERPPDAEEREILKQIDYASLVRVGAVKAARSPVMRRTELCRLLEVSDLKAFGELAEQNDLALAAYKDTKQQTNPVSGAIWLQLGRKSAQKVVVKPYDRDKLRDAVSQLRELTQSPLDVDHRGGAAYPCGSGSCAGVRSDHEAIRFPRLHPAAYASEGDDHPRLEIPERVPILVDPLPRNRAPFAAHQQSRGCDH
jgi:YgiT-type zinc finger domain-containing protein